MVSMKSDQARLSERRERGRDLFRMGAVMQYMGDTWLVAGKVVNLFKLTCECRDYTRYKDLTQEGFRCKHMFAAIFAQEELDARTREKLANLRREKEAAHYGSDNPRPYG